SASVAHFGAECKTAQAQDRRDQDGEGVGLSRALRRRVVRRRRRKIGAIRTEKASASVARFGAAWKPAQAQDRRDQDGEGVGLSRALRRRVEDGAGARSARSGRRRRRPQSRASAPSARRRRRKIGAIRTEKASASVARFGAECKTAQA
ncbi:hypothetical protein PR002_g32711, partial [Phytophthora rubi]